METIILIIHVLLGVALVALVLIQQGKGASMGASFG
ncbi:MAG TPA: preprotein translocase subunit SecG, partial [Pseudomonadales bacterium]|nr:preprotein translocase subunit SecG [Pseudomonadales bacterium]